MTSEYVAQLDESEDTLPAGTNLPLARTQGVESPRRVLQVLLSFSRDKPFATVLDLSTRLGMSVSTTYRYVSLLREMGLLEESSRSSYQVGPVVLSVAAAAQAANPIGQLARPMMEQLSSEFDETVMLSQVVGNSSVCVALLEPSRPVRLTMQPGYSVPLHSGASGKTLLAFLDGKDREAYFDARAATDSVFAGKREALTEELAAIRIRGGAVAQEEIDEGIWSNAVAVTLRDGRTLASLSIAGPAYRIDSELKDRMWQGLLRESKKLKSALDDYGY